MFSSPAPPDTSAASFLKMARKGRVYLIGRGSNRANPIHGADLAEACVDAVYGERQEIDIGGPQTFTYREIAEACVLHHRDDR